MGIQLQPVTTQGNSNSAGQGAFKRFGSGFWRLTKWGMLGLGTLTLLSVILGDRELIVEKAETKQPTVPVSEKYGRGFIVAQSKYGDRWPFPSIESAIIRCKMKQYGSYARPVVTVELDGRVYALNGVAMGNEGLPNARHLQARDKYDVLVMGAIPEFIKNAIEQCVE